MWKIVFLDNFWWVEEEKYQIGPFVSRQEALEAATFMYGAEK